MADNRKYRFVGKDYSEGGRASVIMAAISFALFLVDAIISFAAEGNAGSIVGLLLSVYGFYVGMRSFADKDVSQRMSVIGSISCGVIMIGWLTLLLRGLR